MVTSVHYIVVLHLPEYKYTPILHLVIHFQEAEALAAALEEEERARQEAQEQEASLSKEASDVTLQT